MTDRERARLDVFRSYHAYVLALRGYALGEDHVAVRQSRANLARAIEVACLIDPNLLGDFKQSFGTRPSQGPRRD